MKKVIWSFWIKWNFCGVFLMYLFIEIELLNNKLHGLSPPGGFVSPSGRFASLLFGQAVLKNSQRHLADRNVICILYRSDCAWLCCLLSQFVSWHSISVISLYTTELSKLWQCYFDTFYKIKQNKFGTFWPSFGFLEWQHQNTIVQQFCKQTTKTSWRDLVI